MMKKSCAIRPAEFYGSGLPRPRFIDNTNRVDPPLSVLDPLLSWARDAHWSMGGLNFTRLRLQGRIEGNVNKLRAQLEKSSPVKLHPDTKNNKKRSGSESPPAAPFALKRRRYLDLNDDDEEEIGSEDEFFGRIRRRLSDDFDRVAVETKTKVVKANNKSPESESLAKKPDETSPKRTSPRLSKRRSS